MDPGVSREGIDVRIEPWGMGDLAVLRRLNEPDMTKHVGGPETIDKVGERQRGYEKPGSRQYAIVEPGGQHIGWVGYWERTWRDREVWETGWAVIPDFQGRAPRARPWRSSWAWPGTSACTGTCTRTR